MINICKNSAKYTSMKIYKYKINYIKNIQYIIYGYC